MNVEATLDYTVTVHEEDGAYWAEVEELPGCFAAGDSAEELRDALMEAIGLYLSTPASRVTVQFQNAAPLTVRSQERTLVVC